MHTADLLDQALRAAEQLGYGVRQEWLGGGSGGACEIKGQKWLFIDLSQSLPDQLAMALEALGREPQAAALSLSAPLRKLLPAKKAA